MLVSIDGNSYRIRWQYEAAGPVESTPVIGSDGLVYFGDNAGVIHAVDLAGNPKWTAPVEIAVRSAGALIAPGRLVFGLDDEILIALNCSSPAMDDEGWPKHLRTLTQSTLATP
jgi:outer membrane protein assembly factor BamB